MGGRPDFSYGCCFVIFIIVVFLQIIALICLLNSTERHDSISNAIVGCITVVFLL